MPNIYPAKILLFGEYAVICQGEGLAIPEFQYQMKWAVNNDNGVNLSSYLNYLLQQDIFKNTLDLNSLIIDLKNNVSLSSNIPQGYGLGSSGAVVAAVYDKYARNPIHYNAIMDLRSLRSFLASMENFFHAKSSGLDPLVSLLQQPIYLKSNGDLAIVKNKIDLGKYYKVDLIDSNISRQTANIVDQFNQKMKEEIYKNNIEYVYLNLVSDCIQFCIENNFEKLHESLVRLSEFQLVYFDFAIPESLKQQWKHGIKSGNEIFKLCGAGGGGFMLRFSLDN